MFAIERAQIGSTISDPPKPFEVGRHKTQQAWKHKIPTGTVILKRHPFLPLPTKPTVSTTFWNPTAWRPQLPFSQPKLGCSVVVKFLLLKNPPQSKSKFATTSTQADPELLSLVVKALRDLKPLPSIGPKPSSLLLDRMPQEHHEPDP